jgi:hypothetical protein
MKREKINSRSGAQSLGRIFYKKDKKDLCSTLTATASDYNTSANTFEPEFLLTDWL